MQDQLNNYTVPNNLSDLQIPYYMKGVPFKNTEHYFEKPIRLEAECAMAYNKFWRFRQTLLEHGVNTYMSVDDNMLNSTATFLDSDFATYVRTDAPKCPVDHLDLFGCGPYSRIYLAYDNVTKQFCAVKVFRKANVARRLNGEEAAIKALENERKLLYKISFDSTSDPKSNFIVHLHNTACVAQTKSYAFMLLELADLGNLTYYLSWMSRPLSPLQTATWAGQITLGLTFLHGLGVIHGDLKPDNILVHGSGRLQICGFTKHYNCDIGSKTFTKTFCGSKEYAPPERRWPDCFPDGFDHSVDCFALGLIMYEMMTLERGLLFPLQAPWDRQVEWKLSRIAFDANTKKIILKLTHNLQDSRLGAAGATTQILNEPFFNQIHFPDLEEGSHLHPYGLPLKPNELKRSEYTDTVQFAPTEINEGAFNLPNWGETTEPGK
ncbi:hypothetical protein SNEBB_010228 [Seison nebaliae]|nr:hypothetical protein SNEBB_010228 [Seison nebaliae]